MKEKITSLILNDLSGFLDQKQFELLQSSLIRHLYNVEISESNTSLAATRVDNDVALRYFAMSLSVEQHSKKTIRQYIRSARSLFEFINKDFRDINTEDIKYYLAYMSKTRNWKSSTTNNIRKFTKSFFSWAHENEYISKNPFTKIKAFKISQPAKTTLSDNELELIRDTAQTTFSRAIVDFLCSTGVRVSELCLLDRDDINLSTGKVNIFAPKTQTWRIVYLDAKAKKHLFDYFQTRTDTNPAAFLTKTGIRIYPRSIELLIHSLTTACGISKHVTVHTFRKTLASRLFRRHVDLLTIATILGHSSTATTEKYYIKVDCDDVQYQYNLIN